jgi:hypothetical protein
MRKIFYNANKDDQQNRDAQTGCAQAGKARRGAQAGRLEAKVGI